MYKLKIQIKNNWLSINYEFKSNDNISFGIKIIWVAIKVSATIEIIKIAFSILSLSG
ncbi:MAG: hypothetical protein LBN23_07620 [Paludibacter sp.]|jgi:hypothetical protein|nr:hypothetical protein [Paludibacter sp.]